MGVPSLVLGVAPLLSASRTARLIGLDNNPAVRALLRTLAARELVVAVLFLRHGTPPWLWGFVAQDAVDLAVWTALMVRRHYPHSRRTRITYAVYLGLAAIDIYTAVTRTARLRQSRTPGTGCERG